MRCNDTIRRRARRQTHDVVGSLTLTRRAGLRMPKPQSLLCTTPTLGRLGWRMWQCRSGKAAHTEREKKRALINLPAGTRPFHRRQVARRRKLAAIDLPLLLLPACLRAGEEAPCSHAPIFPS